MIPQEETRKNLYDMVLMSYGLNLIVNERQVTESEKQRFMESTPKFIRGINFIPDQAYIRSGSPDTLKLNHEEFKVLMRRHYNIFENKLD